VLCAAPASGQPRLSASATPARLATLTLLLKVSATVTDYRGHRRTLFFLPGVISLFIMCVGIILNNSLVEGGRAPDRALNPAPEERHDPLHKAPE